MAYDQKAKMTYDQNSEISYAAFTKILSNTVDILNYGVKNSSIKISHIYFCPEEARNSLKSHLEWIYGLIRGFFPEEFFQYEKDAILTSFWLLENSSIINPQLWNVLLNLLGIIEGIKAFYDYSHQSDQSEATSNNSQES